MLVIEWRWTVLRTGLLSLTLLDFEFRVTNSNNPVQKNRNLLLPHTFCAISCVISHRVMPSISGILYCIPIPLLYYYSIRLSPRGSLRLWEELIGYLSVYMGLYYAATLKYSYGFPSCGFLYYTSFSSYIYHVFLLPLMYLTVASRLQIVGIITLLTIHFSLYTLSSLPLYDLPRWLIATTLYTHHFNTYCHPKTQFRSRHTSGIEI